MPSSTHIHYGCDVFECKVAEDTLVRVGEDEFVHLYKAAGSVLHFPSDYGTASLFLRVI